MHQVQIQSLNSQQGTNVNPTGHKYGINNNK